MPLTVRAYAKLNLTLEVLGRRPDGYHEVATVLQAVSLADTLIFEPAERLELLCADPHLSGDENLVLRAARLLVEATGRRGGARITLEKDIPPAAGLGGGSSDAAATLWALDRLWGLRLPEARLHQLAGDLGSDVPFFLGGGAALATGRGEVLEPLPAPPEGWFVVLTPALQIPRKTATVYGMVREQHWTQGKVSRLLAAAIQRGEPVREALLFNAFDAVVPPEYPAVGYWRRHLLEAIANRPHLTGTGPSLFIPVRDEAEGRRVASALPADEPAAVFVVHTVPSGREVVSE